MGKCPDSREMAHNIQRRVGAPYPGQCWPHGDGIVMQQSDIRSDCVVTFVNVRANVPGGLHNIARLVMLASWISKALNHRVG